MEGGTYSFGPVNHAEGTVVASDVAEIVALPFVKWVEEQPISTPGQANRTDNPANATPGRAERGVVSIGRRTWRPINITLAILAAPVCI